MDMSAEIFADVLVDPIMQFVVVSLLVLAHYLRFRQNRGPPTLRSSKYLNKIGCERKAVATRHQDGACDLMYRFTQHAQKGNWEDMIQTLDDIDKRCRDRLDVTDYCCIVKRLARGGDPITAHKWLQRAVSGGLRPTQTMYICVVSSYAKAGFIEKGLSMARAMESAGFKLDTAAYNTIMDAWRRAYDVTQVQSWMEKMLADGVQPNVVSFGIVVPACAHAGLLDDVDRWFKLAQRLNIGLGFRTLQSVVWSCITRKDPSNTTRWVTIMIEQGLQPTDWCILVALSARYDHIFDAEFAVGVVDKMRAAGLRPGCGVYSRCIVAAAMCGLGSKAQELANECAAHHGSLLSVAKRAMIQAGLSVPSCGMHEAQTAEECLR